MKTKCALANIPQRNHLCSRKKLHFLQQIMFLSAPCLRHWTSKNHCKNAYYYYSWLACGSFGFLEPPISPKIHSNPTKIYEKPCEATKNPQTSPPQISFSMRHQWNTEVFREAVKVAGLYSSLYDCCRAHTKQGSDEDKQFGGTVHEHD